MSPMRFCVFEPYCILSSESQVFRHGIFHMAPSSPSHRVFGISPIASAPGIPSHEFLESIRNFLHVHRCRPTHIDANSIHERRFGAIIGGTVRYDLARKRRSRARRCSPSRWPTNREDIARTQTPLRAMATIKLTCGSPKDPAEKLEELRRISRVEFEHLNAAQTASPKLSNRVMPEHSAMPALPVHSANSSDSPPMPTLPGLSSSPQLQQEPHPSVTRATATDIHNQTPVTGQAPLLTQPHFNENMDMRKRTFPAEGAGEADAMNPTER